ncbi:tyrosine-type recombinase/integrase [Bifidobacterium crudilactis]|jgi:integrase|uniref:tyrosine-type recombinase/integrase n=1 Tax=Bifidobacterium crudilactis TaxID=327277 RepID=UPI0023526C92|nr:site-specific integrase [Bifidobacterium crudilactis]MCI1218548.1 site-specific integrase [Bifidobacterium crudilactis]
MAKGDTSGQITELERGHKYSIRVRLAPDDAHKSWHWSKSRKVIGNKAEATAQLVAYKQELDDTASGKNVTVSEYANAFQTNRKALGKVSPLTLERDRHEINLIAHYLGKNRVIDLDSAIIEKAYLKMVEHGGISPDGVHKVHMKLSQIMRKAYLEGLIERNPCDAVEGIRRPKPDQRKKQERRVTKEQAITFIQKLRNEEQDGRIIAVWLGVATGLRRGEALALVWDDIDLKKNMLHIRNQYGKERILKEPKTTRSRRTISIDIQTVEFLSSWKRKQQAMLKHAGLRQAGDTPVCSNELFEFIDPDDFSRWRRKFFVKEGLAHYAKEEKYVDRRGIERIRRTGYVGPNFHALRHAQATLLVAGGIDPKTVQARLGHESLNTTLGIYAEEVAENDVKAASYMGEILSPNGIA